MIMVLKANNKLLVLYTIVLVILCSGHAFQTIFPSRVKLILFPFVFLVVLWELLTRDNGMIDRVQLTVLLFGVMIACTTVVGLGSGLSFYITQVCYIIAAYGITRLYSFQQTINCYLKVMTVVAVVALAGYVFVQNTSVLNSLPAMSNVNDVEYRVGGIFNYIPAIPDRNCGMFWEPGLFATHLTLSIVFELLFREKSSLLRLALFSACIVTANSSAGFVLWFLCVMLWLTKKNAVTNNALGRFLGVIIIGLGIAVIVEFDSLITQTALAKNEYFQKLTADSLADASRVKAIGHNLSQFLSAPLFGVGVAGVSASMKYVADTSTSTYMLSIFGAMGSLYTFAWGYGILKKVRAGLAARILLLIIILVIVNKEPHHQMLFSWCLMFYLIEGKLEGIRQKPAVPSMEENLQ